MKKTILFTISFILILTGICYALRIPKPKHITELNESAIIAINENFERLWEVTKGKLNFTITTTNPDGNTYGNGGDVLIFNNSGTYYLEINTTGSNVWRGVVLTDVP